MDTKTKILIGVAVLLVVIFIVGTGVGVAGGNAKGQTTPVSLDDNPLVRGFGNLLPGPPALSVKDVSSSDPQCPVTGQLTIPKNQTCVYAVASSSMTTRRLPVPSSTRAHILLHPPDGSKTAIDERLTLPDSAHTDHLDVYQDRGTLTITCLPTNPAACVFSLAP